MKLQITIPSPSPDLPEEVYNIDCPFCETASVQMKRYFETEIKTIYVIITNVSYSNIETKYIN